MSMKRLENWSIILKGNPYTAPELMTKHLHGNVYNHPKFLDGTEITTTEIKWIGLTTIITASGSEYEIGAVNPEYEAAYPNAYARLMQLYFDKE